MVVLLVHICLLPLLASFGCTFPPINSQILIIFLLLLPALALECFGGFSNNGVGVVPISLVIIKYH